MNVGKIKNLILLSIGIIAIIIVTIIGICIKNKTKETNSKAKEKFNNEEILINVNEEVEEFASIEELEKALEEGFATEGPVIIDIPIDYRDNEKLGETILPDQFY